MIDKISQGKSAMVVSATDTIRRRLYACLDRLSALVSDQMESKEEVTREDVAIVAMLTKSFSELSKDEREAATKMGVHGLSTEELKQLAKDIFDDGK